MDTCRKTHLQSSFSFSSRAKLSVGCLRMSSLAEARPTMPPPTTATSYELQNTHSQKNRSKSNECTLLHSTAERHPSLFPLFCHWIKLSHTFTHRQCHNRPHTNDTVCQDQQEVTSLLIATNLKETSIGKWLVEQYTLHVTNTECV